MKLYSEALDPVLKELVDKPSINHDNVQRAISGKIRSMEKDIDASKLTIEESAKKLSAITKETVAENFAEGKKALDSSIEKSKEVDEVIGKYTKGNGTKVAGKIRQLEKEKELLETGKGAIDYIMALGEAEKYEETKRELFSGRRYRLIGIMKYVADSLDNDSKYNTSREAIYKLNLEMVSSLKKEFINYKEMNNYDKINVCEYCIQ